MTALAHDDGMAWVEDQFSRCWPMLQTALNAFPVKTHEREHVWQSIVDGQAQLWPTENSCCVSEIKNYPTGLSVLHVWLAGGDLTEIKQTSATLEAWARKQGLHFNQIAGRRGWLRTLDGYREACTVMMKELC